MAQRNSVDELTNKPIFGRLFADSGKEAAMPTTLNVNEAKTHFSSVVSEVEKNLVAFTIMRYLSLIHI